MDELVRQALARWPDVPDCTGWLALDARGRWRVGEAGAGTRMPITHQAMIAFINRNYFSTGRFWIFQNGPQRVFVELEYTPFVWRLHPQESGGWDLVAHTGITMTPSAVWLDDQGRFLMQARSSAGEPIVGVVHDHDTALLAEQLRDDDGDLLDDETMSRLSSPLPSSRSGETETPRAVLYFPSTNAQSLRLPLQRIASHQVAACFGFEPRPSQALRVDFDTRR
jgi:hypothetical protein